MVARILDASNISLAYPNYSNNYAPYTSNYCQLGESNGLGAKGGNSNTSAIGSTTSNVESGVRSVIAQTDNTSATNTQKGLGAYFVAPKCTGSTSSNIDIRDTADGRTHTTVPKVHCTWRVSIGAFSYGAQFTHYNFVPLGVYDTAGTLIAGVRLQHRGEAYVFYLEPYLATTNPGDTYLGQVRHGLGTQDSTEHSGAAQYMTVELVVDTTLSSPTSDSTRAAARIVLPSGQAQPWAVATWDSSDRSTSENACDSWQIWSQERDNTTGRPSNYPALQLDSYHHVDGTDWWANYDTYGVGFDGFGHGVKIAALKPASDIYQDTSGWTKSAGSTWWECIDDQPVSPGDFISCTTADKIITFGMESFLTKAGWSATPYGEILGVVPKVYTNFYNAADYYYGSNIRFGVANSSNATYTQSGSLGDSYTEGSSGCSRQLHCVLHHGVNEKPSGGAWAASSIDSDLRLWLKAGTFYGATKKYPTVYDACVYVLYREPQRAVGASSGGQGVLSAVPTLTRPRVASGAGRDCSKIDIADTSAPNGSNWYRSFELPTTDSNGVTNNFVFADWSPVTNKYYACAWDKNLWNNADPTGAASGRAPCVAEIDPATGTTKIIWRADENTTGGSATAGGPHHGASGGWYWPSTGASGAPRAMRPHFLKVDKRPKFLDGTTNPFYGHLFVSFTDGANVISPPVVQNLGLLWLDPNQARTSDYCYGRWLPWERGSDAGAKGALGVCVTEDFVYAAAPLENGTNHGVVHRFNKKNFNAGSDWSGGTVGVGYPIQSQAADWDVAFDSGTSVAVSTLQHAVNQMYYLGGKVWVTGAVLYGFTPGDSANGDGGGTLLGPWLCQAGTNIVDEFNIRQVSMHPTTGTLWCFGQWMAGSGSIGNSRIKDWLATWEQSGARTGLWGSDTLGLFEMDSSNGNVLRYWRVPLEITDDARNTDLTKQGAWRDDTYDDTMSIHGGHWLDEDTFLLAIGEHRSAGDYASTTEWPRSTLMVFRRGEETWHQVPKPALNMIALCNVDVLATDRGRFSSGSSDAPPNRHDMMSLGGATEVQDPSTWDSAGRRFRYLWTDIGFTKAGDNVPNYYTYAGTGATVGADSKGHVIEVTARPPLMRENEIQVTATIDLTGTSVAGIDEWRMELRSGGTIGQGGLFASGGAVTADGNGKVRLRGYVQSSEWQPGGSSADIDVFWRTTVSGRQYWNSRSTS